MVVGGERELGVPPGVTEGKLRCGRVGPESGGRKFSRQEPYYIDKLKS